MRAFRPAAIAAIAAIAGAVLVAACQGRPSLALRSTGASIWRICSWSDGGGGCRAR